ncbi:MAG: alpha/beta-type small acid-soluble spore protein [Firmicutes bacterium]|nr:alpha/beta-type small acid-soluble spore protein [Bacillota bacterium]
MTPRRAGNIIVAGRHKEVVDVVEDRERPVASAPKDTPAEREDRARERLKYEVAEELGLRDDIERRGWAHMTTREAGKVGGHMVRRMIRFAERRMARDGHVPGEAEKPE